MADLTPDAIERLRVQLAGCSVAALGGTKDPAKQGDYGWSPAYQDVLDLRLERDILKRKIEDMTDSAYHGADVNEHIQARIERLEDEINEIMNRNVALKADQDSWRRLSERLSERFKVLERENRELREAIAKMGNVALDELRRLITTGDSG